MRRSRPSETPKQRLIEGRLGMPVADWVDAARAEGIASTWAELAVELSKVSREHLSHETLRTWCQRSRSGEAVAT